MRTGILIATACLAGCYELRHSPGYNERGSMTKQTLRVQTPQMCLSGTCDKDGPEGPVKFARVWFFSAGDHREETRFEVTYAGARARCSSATDGQPFECRIDAAGESYRLSLGQGCTEGLLSANSAEWSLHTDVITMGGRNAPGNEVSLVDAGGVVVSSSASGGGDNIDLFTRGQALPPPHLLAVAATHAFLQLDDRPKACISGA